MSTPKHRIYTHPAHATTSVVRIDEPIFLLHFEFTSRHETTSLQLDLRLERWPLERCRCIASGLCCFVLIIIILLLVERRFCCSW